GRRLAASHLGVAIAAFGIAAFMALMQALSRANLDLPWRTARMYYLSVTAHGVLMALVFTTFFIMGLGVALTTQALGRPQQLPRLGWTAFWLAVAGTAGAAWAILWGKATVLYTFYPPLQAHPAFYIGLTLVVVGSWLWGADIIATYRAWRRDHPATPVPLAVHGLLATIIVWYIATVGVAAEMLVQLIPWSLGLTPRVDPMLARMLFWYFGHPLVYFWLLPAYVVWYTVLPRVAGGKLFSDPLGRMVFALFIVLSTPVGFHHQFMDPAITAGWKAFHAFNTAWILFPSFVTAFTVLASLEIAGRRRGATGLFDWIGKLPWHDPLVSSVLLSMLLFAVGGFGGAINASFGMNALVHNTAWIQGHFHLTVGSAVALTFMGTAYWLVPRLVNRELELKLLAQVQPYLWFLGMALFSFANHVTGLQGMPRRIFDPSYLGSPAAEQWRALTGVSAAGGLLLFTSAAFFLLVILGTVLAGKRAAGEPLEFAEPVEGPPERQTVFDRWGLWVTAAVVLVVLAYAAPLVQHLHLERFGSPGFKPF
ncbi:MAG TPA: cbb3-type cytochrome c oxidase subunit I, partial [Gemmatimonadales bacterium]|nr:cbb3-type cytochrome c oxidase subunit I [Gemmatimonadales bacterium]